MTSTSTLADPRIVEPVNTIEDSATVPLETWIALTPLPGHSNVACTPEKVMFELDWKLDPLRRIRKVCCVVPMAVMVDSLNRIEV
jgi:hypothetical protein